MAMVMRRARRLVQSMEEIMEQILCMVSEEAKDVLKDWQKLKRFSKQGEALQDLLIEFRDRHLGENKIDEATKS